MKIAGWIRLLGLLMIWLLFIVVPIHAQETPPPAPDQPDVTGITADARRLVTEALAAYRRGEFQDAFKLARAAYLDYFENAEPPLRTLNRDLVVDMEYKFAELRSKLQLRRPPEEVEKLVGDVRGGLIEIDSMFDASGARLAPLIAGSTSFVIALRQGLESILVISLVIGALRASGTRGMGRHVLLGAGAALVVSGLAWALLHTLLVNIAVAQQVITALAAVGAVVMLFWVNLWVARRLDARYWLETMSAKAWARLAAQNSVGFLLIGFSTFFRQGIETALTYETLLAYSQRSENYVWLGMGAALVVLLAAGALVARTGRRLSPIFFLKLTLPFLALLSVAFIGGAVWQLQESGYFPVTSAIKYVPRLPYFIAALTGIHPTWETLGAQAALLSMYSLVALLFVLRHPLARLRYALRATTKVSHA